MLRSSTTPYQGRCAVHGGRSTIGTVDTFDLFFKNINPLIFPEAELFTNISIIGNVSVSYDSGFANKQIKITLPTSITTIQHRIFTGCDFAQSQLVIPANAADINSSGGFKDITSLSEILFLAERYTNFKGYNLFDNTSANIVFPNAKEVPVPNYTLGNFKGCVYVPDALVDSWKVASNWSAIASRIRPLSEWVTQ